MADWHAHIFPSSRSWDSDDEGCRFDVIEQEDGLITVIDPFAVGKDRLHCICVTREEAMLKAQMLADACEEKQHG